MRAVKFSIVIPVYNAAPYLRACLDSVCVAAEKVEKEVEKEVERVGGGGQRREKPLVEVICVDDGSTDGSGEILDEYASRFNSSTLQPFNSSTLQPFNPSTFQPFNPSTFQPFNLSTFQPFNLSTLQPFNLSTFQPFNLSTFQPFNFPTFKVIHQENRGEGAARNAALSVAKGDWVVFLDSDDLIKEDLLQFVVEQSKLHPRAEMVTYVAECFEDGSLPDWHPRFDDKPRVLSVETELPSELAWYGICCFAVRRERLKGLAFQDFKLGADVVFVFQVLLRVKEVLLTKDVKYGYRLVSTSMSHKTRSPALVTDHIRYMRALFKDCAGSRKKLGVGFATKRITQLVAVVGSELLPHFNDREWERTRAEWYLALADLKKYDFLMLLQKVVIRSLLIARCRLAVALLCAVPLRLKQAMGAH